VDGPRVPPFDFPPIYMKQNLCLAFAISAILFCTGAASGQKRDAAPHTAYHSDPGVVIVGSAAKGTWVLTKFAAANIAKPVAKAVLLDATPAVTKFVIKNAAKELLPLALKLSVL